MPREKQMSTQHSDIEKIKKYLSGDFSSEEQLLFEKKIQEDSFLNDALKGYQEFPESLKKQTTLHKQNPFGSKNYMYWGLFLGAISLVGIWFFIPKNTPELPNKESIKNDSKVSSIDIQLVEKTIKTPDLDLSKIETKVPNEVIFSPIEKVSTLPVIENEKLKVSSINDSIISLDTNKFFATTNDNLNTDIIAENKGSKKPTIKVEKTEIDLAPYFAFTDNKLKFMLIKPLNKGNDFSKQSKKVKKEQQRLENKVNLALNALKSIKKADYIKAQDYLTEYEKLKDNDPEMLTWLNCLKAVHAEDWASCDSSITSLSQNATAIGLQGKRLKLEIVELLENN